jgi:trehalose synthase
MDFQVPRIEHYGPLVGAQTVGRILAKAKRPAGFPVTRVNSSCYGGGVAELLSTLTLLLNGLGIRAGWRVLQGAPDFFGLTKNMHNALQGMPFEFTPVKQHICEEVVFQNSLRKRLNHDIVIVPDPQQRPIPEFSFLPAIDPFSSKNRELSEATMPERLADYDIPTDLPLVVQVSRFDLWKNPKGVVEAFRIACQEALQHFVKTHQKGMPLRKPGNSGGPPMGVRHPPALLTMKMKKTTLKAVIRYLFIRIQGRISSIEAPVVPNRFVKHRLP